MGLAAKGPKLFTCPNCRKAYLGHDPLPDCPACGFDYRVREGFRWDVLVYLLSILGLMSYFLVSTSYRSLITEPISNERAVSVVSGEEKLPGSRQVPLSYPPDPRASH
ncbi:MAG TPA: hypothetical protein VF819_07445 [Nitrospira sp.]